MKEFIPPKAKKIPESKTYHGDTRVDNYSWMSDRKSSDFLEYIKAENEYFSQYIADNNLIKDKIYNEIISRIPGDDIDVPYIKSGYLYYNKRETGKEYKIFCRKEDREGAEEEILLDLNELVKERRLSYCTMFSRICNDNVLVYEIDSKGNFTTAISFLYMDSKETLEDTLEYGLCAILSKEEKYAFYLNTDPVKGKFSKLMRHKMGTPQSEDEVIYDERDEKFLMDMHTASASGEFIFFRSGSLTSQEILTITTTHPEEPPKVIVPRGLNCRAFVEDNLEYFYILTNYGDCEQRIMRTPIFDPRVDNWKEFYECPNGGSVEQMQMFKDYLALVVKERGLYSINVINLRTDVVSEVKMPESPGLIMLGDNYEFESQRLRFVFTSQITSHADYEYNMKSGELKLLKEKEVKGDYDKNLYASERVMAQSRDGKEIPVTLLYKKDIKLNGENPLLLYGYGSFGSSSEPYFDYSLFSLIDRGFIYAIAHVRGGRELGEDWWKDGMLLKKKNTFNDFIDTAEYLINMKYTSAGLITAMGGSAGGMLVAGVANMRPDLFKCVIPDVPAVDLLNNLLEKTEFNADLVSNEMGDPREESYYHTIKSYDPYENVRAQNYPHVFVKTGYNDSNVSCTEPAKYVAKLRELNQSENIILMKTSFDSGHFGVSGRYAYYKDIAEGYALILKLYGIQE